MLWRLGVLLLAAVLLTPLRAQADQTTPAATPPPALHRVSETVLDPTARGNVTWAATANVASYQQDALVTEGNFQYTAWYAADRTAVLARRVLPSGPWQSIRLDAVLYADDSHNNITLAISPRDGRLHVALATHADQVRYVRSVPGVTTGAAPWASTSFEPVAARLPGATGAPRSWTYPTFERFGEDLLLTWRAGSSVRGRQTLARYDPAGGGSWRYLGTFTGHGGEWSSAHGTSTSRYAYLHGFARNPVTGDLEITWTWREQQVAQDPRCPEAPANRDLGYARSPDGGLTWLNDAGAVIGRTGTTDVITTDDAQVVTAIPVESGMINQESQAFDSAGRIHVITSQVDPAALSALGGCLTGDYYAARAAHAQPVHHWRDADGWHSAAIPVSLGSGGRSQLVFDATDTAHLVLPDGRVAAAGAEDGWSEWSIVADDDVDSISELSLDRFRMARDGVLSVVRQGTGVPRHAPSPYSVIDFAAGSGDTAAAVARTVTAAPPRAYAGSAPVWPTAVATSRQPNFPAHFATDGDRSSHWMSGRPVRQLVDGIEWVSLADALEAFDGQASVARPQVLTISHPSPQWVGRITLDPGGLRGPRDWWARGRVDGRWVDLLKVSGQPQQAKTHAVPRTRIDTLQVFVTRGHHAPHVRIAEVRTADRVPNNRIVTRPARRQPKRARALLPVTVREQGVLRLFRNPRVRAHSMVVSKAGSVTLVVQPRGAVARRLSVKRCRRAPGDRVSAVVRVKVRFTPTGGRAATVTRSVRLVRRC